MVDRGAAGGDQAGTPAGKLVVDGELALKLKSRGEFPLTIDGRAYTLVRKPGLMAPNDSLRSADGRLVPPTTKHVARTRAEAGSRCAQHAQRAAALVCPRCGSYACDDCTGADATHCRACTDRLTADAEKHARDLMFMAPAFVFVVTGGAIGAALGFAAGAAAVAVARRTDSALLKWGAAIGFYLVAVVVFVIAAGALQLATGR